MPVAEFNTYVSRSEVLNQLIAAGLDEVDAMTPEQHFALACRFLWDMWVPACGGTEKPFTCKGRTLLYCFNPATGKHAYIDCGRDMALTDDEAREILG